MKKHPASLLLFVLLTFNFASNVQAFPTQSSTLGSAGTPGSLDNEFKSLLGGNLSVQFIGKPDVRTAMVQADGKILIGGTFRISASNVKYANYTTNSTIDATDEFSDPVEVAIKFTVVWRNLARLNADGSLDTSFISNSALQVAKAQNKADVEWGPDGAVYSILVILKDDLYQYLVAGDFLNFSHNAKGNAAPRLRYFMLDVLAADPTIPVTDGATEPLVALSDNVSNGDGFNGPVRKIRRMVGAIIGPTLPSVPDRVTRLKTPAAIGERLYQEDNGFLYEKIGTGTGDQDWEELPADRRQLYFAAGDFTSFVNDTDERFITRFNFQPGGITILRTQWMYSQLPDKRVWDVTSLGARIFYVGEFDSIVDSKLSKQTGKTELVHWHKIARITESGDVESSAVVNHFDPGTGFNNTAMSIVADPINNNVVVAGYFTEYDGNTVGRIARVSVDGAMVAGFPAANNGNAEGANGPIRVVTRQPDGRFFIAGEFTTYNGIKRAGLARLESDGSLDLTFVPAGNASGIQNFAFDMDGGPATASLFARPIAVGNFSKLFGSSYTGVARFIGGSFPVVWYQPNKINAPFAVSLGENKRLSVAATDNFVGFTGEAGLPSGLEELPFESPQTPAEPLLYQWEKNGKEIEGEVLSYLDIENFKPSDVAKYRVRIWNSQFSVYSEAVNVALRNPFTDVLPDNGLQVEGLIEANETLNGGLGGFVKFTVTRTGMVTGTVTLGNAGGKTVKVSFRRQYNFDSGLEIQIPLPNKSPLVLRLKTDFSPGQTSFDFTGPENYLTDSFGTTAQIAASNIPWSKTRSAKDFAGKYNIGLQTDPGAMEELVGTPPADQPMVSQGFGFLSMQVKDTTGMARIAGYLADGTKVTASSAVRGDADGTVTLWLPLYAAQGSLAGTFNILSEADADGVLAPDAVNPIAADLKWSKPPGVPKSPDVSGFTSISVTAVDGSGLYNPVGVPTSLSSLSIGHGAWDGKPGALTSGTISADGDNPNALTFSLSANNGLAKGGFVDPDSQGRPRKIKYQAITLTGTGSPGTYGFFIMPSSAKNPDFYVGGSVTGF